MLEFLKSVKIVLIHCYSKSAGVEVFKYCEQGVSLLPEGFPCCSSLGKNVVPEGHCRSIWV